jgi:pSer/pThr/pTyr-binding forkhead associated (FHA) protein
MDVNLVLFKKDGSQKSFFLPSPVTVIGRRHDCDLCVPLMVVSRRHCQLNYNNETFKIRDLGSRNGTFLNGKRVDEAALRPGDYITVGPLTFLLQIDGQPKEIIPPEQARKRQAPPDVRQTAADRKKMEAEPADESFPELELDESDSFLDDLEDV